MNEISNDPITYSINRLLNSEQGSVTVGAFSSHSLKTALRTNDYVSALRYLHSLSSPAEKLSAIDSFYYKHYPFLLQERAFAEFEKAPTAKTLHTVALPLIHLNAIRIEMDLSYFDNEEVEQELMEKVHTLKQLARQRLEEIASCFEIPFSDELKRQEVLSTFFRLSYLKWGTKPYWIYKANTNLAGVPLTTTRKTLLMLENEIVKAAKVLIDTPESLSKNGKANPIQLASRRDCEETVAKAIESHKSGLRNKEALARDLEACDYTAILSKIWAEEDQEKKLEFLRQESLQQTPFILSERAFAEFKVNPTKETLCTVCIPLLLFNYALLTAQAHCINDKALLYLLQVLGDKEQNFLEKLAIDKGIELSPRDHFTITGATLPYFHKIRSHFTPGNPTWLKEISDMRPFTVEGRQIGEICQDQLSTQQTHLSELEEDLHTVQWRHR